MTSSALMQITDLSDADVYLSMSAIMKLTRHGAITRTHTPCLVVANMAHVGHVSQCHSFGVMRSLQSYCS